MSEKKITIGLNELDVLLRGIEEYEAWLERKCGELAKRLGDMGALNAQWYYDGAQYLGNTDCRITVDQTGANAYTVKAEGASVLFIEFGAGVTHGYGHPEVQNFGPGTWPDKHYRVGKDGKLIANWENREGWYTPLGQHTYGNPPNAFMYNAVKDLSSEIQSAVKEVFAGD